MPSLFIGHGSPMNALEINEFSGEWQSLGTALPQPTAILCISAHWKTRGTLITGMEKPKTIHDFYGFPPELYAMEYNAEGSPQLASSISEDIQSVGIDFDWGFDHGAWSILQHLYPNANIPVLQMSIDYTKSMQQHYELAQELKALRKKGVLILGSGNIVHNLRMMAMKSSNINDEFAFDWAKEVNEAVKAKIKENDVQALVKYNQLNKGYQLAIPTLEHYIPMIYALGVQEKEDEVHFFNDKLIAGSLSMTSFIVA